MIQHWFRRAGAALVAVVFAAGLMAGCSGKQEPPAQQAPTPAQSQPEPQPTVEPEPKPWTGTIRLWDAPRWRDENDDPYHWIKAKIKQFEAENEGVTIEFTEVPWDDVQQKIKVSVVGGSWPDIAPVDISGGRVPIELAEEGVLEAMDGYFTAAELEDFYPATIDAWSYEGQLYGIPNSVTVHALLLNLDLFRERGVEPPKDGKWTYDEFVQKMKQLTFDRNGDGQDDVWGFSTYILNNYYESWPMLFIDGGSAFPENGKLNLTSPELISGLQKLTDLKFVHKVMPPEAGSADVGGTFQAFANQEKRFIAVEPWASWAIATLRNSAKFKMDFAVAEYPTGKTGQPVTISGAGGWLVFKQDDAAKRDMVVKLAKFITTTEDQVAFAQKYGVFPVRKSAMVQDPFSDNPHMQRAAQMLDSAVSLPSHKNWKLIEERIQAQLQLAMSGDKSPEETLKQAAKEAEQFLTQ